MADIITPFYYQISSNIGLYIFDIKSLDQKLISLLDTNFVSICQGNSGNNLCDVKQNIKNRYSGKNMKWKIGATAEFFLHLFMIQNGFKQECLFCNLEENSIKKGFDGYYSKNNEEWIMESKSGLDTKKTIKHSTKIMTAFIDLSNKISGTSKKNKKQINNPWMNALNHANLITVNSDAKIRNNLNDLAIKYDNKQYSIIDNYNVIPCATIYLDNIGTFRKDDLIRDEILKIKDKLRGKKINLICVTTKTVKIFTDYLEI